MWNLKLNDIKKRFKEFYDIAMWRLFKKPRPLLQSTVLPETKEKWPSESWWKDFEDYNENSKIKTDMEKWDVQISSAESVNEEFEEELIHKPIIRLEDENFYVILMQQWLLMNYLIDELLSVVAFRNILWTEFIWTYDWVEYSIEAWKLYFLPSMIAEHFANQIVAFKMKSFWNLENENKCLSGKKEDELIQASKQLKDDIIINFNRLELSIDFSKVELRYKEYQRQI